MKDVFGNYVVQKMFEFGSPKQRKDLYGDICHYVLELACD